MTQSRAVFGRRQGGLAPVGGYSRPSNPVEYGRNRSASAPATAYAPQAPTYQGGYDDQPSTQTQKPTINTGRARPATWMRLVSATIDFTILMVLSFIVMAMFDVMNGPSSVTPVESNGTVLLALFGLWFGYGLVLEASSWQGTIGKKVTGLIVTDDEGEPISFLRSLGRSCGKILSGVVPLYIPYIMVFITKKNKSLHDMMAGTRVYRRRDLGDSVSDYFA